MSTLPGVGPVRERVLVLLVCVPLAALCCDRPSQPPDTRPSPDVAAAPAGDRLPRPQDDAASRIRAAMLSVYYHAYGIDLLESPPPGRPVSLERAAEALYGDRSEGYVARRRRAISKLAAGEVLRPRSGALVPALEILLGSRDTADALLRRMRRLPPPAERDLLPAPGPIPLPILDRRARRIFADRVRVALRFLDEEPRGELARSCCAKVVECSVEWPTSSTDQLGVYFELLVRRSVQTMKASIDPQQWASCVKEYFKQSDYQGDHCNAGSPGLPPDDGSGWDGVLYEWYQVDFDTGEETYFKNRLQICGNWDEDRETYQYHYALCRPDGSLWSSVLNDGPIRGGLAKDCGRLLAIDETADDYPLDHTTVFGVKWLQFAPRDPDNGLAFWSTVGLEELVDGIVDTAMCCGATDEAEDCHLEDEQCVQGGDPPPEDWLKARACEVTGETSPACAEIEME